MKQPDFEGARCYILERLDCELPSDLYYHALLHTRDEVEPAAARLGKMEGLSPEDLLLVRTAALFHDAGYIEQMQDHELISVRMAEEALPGFGYSPEQIGVVKDIILATRLPQKPQTLLERVITDADMDVLGTTEFYPRCLDLQAELAAHGSATSIQQWLRIQEEFMNNHHYHTASARKLRNRQKKQNILLLQQKLNELKQNNPA